MKIGIDVRCLLDGRESGVEEYAKRILRALFSLDRGNQYILFTNSWGSKNTGTAWTRKYPNVTIKRFYFPNKILNLLLWYLKWPKIDRLLGGVEVFFMPNINFIALSPDTKLVLTLHDVSFEIYPETFSWKQRLWHSLIQVQKLLAKADKVFTVSHSSAADVREYFSVSPDKVIVNHNAIPDSYHRIDRNSIKLLEVKEKYDLPYNFLLFLGTIEPRKNLIAVIRAYNTLREHTPQSAKYKLVIAGVKGWKSQSIYKEIAVSPYREDILQIGFVDHEDKTALYNLAHVFIYPSLYEGFGFPVLEAMRCGTPVITSNTSSLTEIAHDSAILIDPYKPDEIYRALKALLEDKKLYEYYLQKGLSRSFAFNWKDAGRKILAVIQDQSQ